MRQRIASGVAPEHICEQLMNDCLAPDCLMGGLGGDNMTVVLICFLHGKPYEHLVERCASSLNAPEHTFLSLANRHLAMPNTEREPLIDDDEEDDDNNELAGDKQMTPASTTTTSSPPKAEPHAEKMEVKLRRVVNKPGENDDDDEHNNDAGADLI